MADHTDTKASDLRWRVLQYGAREHYAIPRALQAAGRLERMYTEAWLGGGPGFRSLVKKLGPLGRAYGGRTHPDVPSGLVTTRPAWHGLADAWLSRNRGKESVSERYARYLELGRRFGGWAAGELAKDPGFGRGSAVFSFNTTALESAELARERGAISVVDQIAPARTEDRWVREETELWPGWQMGIEPVPEEGFARFDQEWAACDAVLVNSPWSAEALVEQGVPRRKLMVVPLAFEPGPRPEPPSRPRKPGELHVLWVGQVGLRKGIQYLIEAARLLEGKPITFTVVGPVLIAPDKVEAAPKNVRFIGRVSREQAEAWYDQADVYLLPTVSDGFALTQLEAMSRGVPVVATPHCGRVVTEGVDGRIVPARDPGAIARVLEEALGDPDMLARWSVAARATSRNYGVDAYARTLVSELGRVMSGSGDAGVARE
ncbi:MAG: glycosyltransferase family 4 protein [Planctomycetota bacterium]